MLEKAKELCKKYWPILLAIIVIFSINFAYSKHVKSSYEEKISSLSKQIDTINTEKQKEIASMDSDKKQVISSYEAKINELHTEVTKLQQSTKENIIKITKPDGTITETTYRESELTSDSSIISDIKQDYENKIKQTETDIKTQYETEIVKIKEDHLSEVKTYQDKISQLESDVSVKVGEKNSVISLGYTDDKKTYLSFERAIFGPLGININVESNFKDMTTPNTSIGAGLSLSF